MRQINTLETNSVSGGSQFLEITEQLLVRGIPESCIGDYYDSNKDNLNRLYAEVVMDEIFQNCPHELNLQFDLVPVSVALVNYP